MIGYSISLFNAAHSILARGASGAPVDADAQAFITAAAITDPTQQAAINTLVVDLKGYSIWTKMSALYPMVGGTSTAHKFNLKNPLDTNAAFRLVFNGGWTHSSTGATPNGTNAYADTFYKPTINGLLNSAHLSYYSRTNSNGTEIELGCQNELLNYHLLEIRTSGITYSLLNQLAGTPSFSDSNSLGFYTANRQGASDIDGWKNGVKKVDGTSSSVANLGSTRNIYLGAYNNSGSVAFYSTKQCAFSSIGDGLTDTEALNFYTAVNAFQVALSRNV